jgi:hypothetical protein
MKEFEKIFWQVRERMNKGWPFEALLELVARTCPYRDDRKGVLIRNGRWYSGCCHVGNKTGQCVFSIC